MLPAPVPSRDRIPLIALLILFPLVCWSWVVVMARDMYGPMTGASAWMMTPQWDAPHLLLLWAMWAVMMTGMMLPSATPMILLVRDAGGTRGRDTYVLALGYVVVWALFSLGATALQWWLGRLFVITPMMEVSSRTAAAVFLIVAGVYQWTPWKQACLTACQSPLAFLMRRWRSGAWGAFRMGVDHGAYCVGCCWALMLLLFAGGVMNLTVIVSLTAFLLAEKLMPPIAQGGRFSGVLLVAFGLYVAAGR
jgi:predicted metal-binding membrane protein